MDVIALHKYGFSAVGSLGTSVSDNQIEELLNLADKIFIVFDGDLPGKNATLRVFDKVLPLLKLGKIFKFVFLPINIDPEEFIEKEGVKTFENKLHEGYSVADMIWLMGLKIKSDNEPETIAKVWNFIRNKVLLIKNNSLRLAIRDELEKRINILRSKNRGYHNSQKKNHNVNLKLPVVGLELRYKAILLLIIYCPAVVSILRSKIDTIKFNNENYNKIKEHILKILFTKPDISSSDLIKKLHQEGFSQYLDNFSFQNIFSRLMVEESKLDEYKCKALLDDLLSMFIKPK